MAEAVHLHVRQPGLLQVFVDPASDLAVADDLGVFALAAIGRAVDLEHDSPSWIGVNELSESYVVGLRFTRGNLETPRPIRVQRRRVRVEVPCACRV